jgi:hypothetical protein
LLCSDSAYWVIFQLACAFHLHIAWPLCLWLYRTAPSCVPSSILRWNCPRSITLDCTESCFRWRCSGWGEISAVDSDLDLRQSTPDGFSR